MKLNFRAGIPRAKKFSSPAKIWCIMRLTIFLILLGCLRVSAGTYGQSVTLSVKGQPLAKVLKAVKAQTGYVFFYDARLISTEAPVTVEVKNLPVKAALDLLLKGRSLTYTIENKTITVIKKQNFENPPHALPQIDIHGKVTDEAGKPLAGVSVIVIKADKRLNIGTATNSDGDFSLTNVDEDVQLRFSYVGYTPQTIYVRGRSTINVSLNIDIKKQIDVVVTFNTGYQSLAKERSTGSFSVINGDKIMQKSGSMNVVDRLEGLAPGLAFNYGQGNDKLLMRGASSVNLDRQPLIILDGVPIAEYRNIESLVNPQDIKDITLLKDATAASIWGAQAANGVIVITTKSGQYNSDKINVSYNGFVSFKGLPDYKSLNLMSSSDFIKANKALFSSAEYAAAFPYGTVSVGFPPIIYPHEQVYYDLQSGTITEATANQRWDSLGGLSNRSQIEKYFYQPALLTSHSISLNGGGKFNRFLSSLSYDHYNNTDGSTKDHYLVNIKEELKIAKWLTFDITGNMAYEQTHSLNATLPAGMSLDTYTPYAMFADNNGKPLSQSYLNMTPDYRQAAEENGGISLDYTPLNELQRNKNNSTSILSRVNSGLRLNLVKGLVLSARGQYQKTVDDGYNFYDETSYPVRLENAQFTQAPSSPDGTPTHYLPVSGGHYYTNHTAVTSWTIRNQLEYNNKIGKDHQVIALAGFEMRSNYFNIINTLTRGYDFQTQTFNSYNQKDLEVTGVSNPVLPQRNTSANTLQSMPLTKAESELRFLSYYGNLAYTYKDRYNFNGSLRYDQSNLFGKSSSSQNKPIWSAGLSWNLQKEDFFNSNVFSKLTPRITYGIAGNSPKPGLGGPFDVLYAISTPMFDGLGPGYIIISPANNQLSWEQTKIFNLGIDFELLSHKVLGSVDYYNKQTTDLLGDSPVDPTTGWTSYYGNIGSLYNKGIEVSITSNNIITNKFSWTTNFNLSYNKNKITSLKRYTPLTPSGLVNGGFIEGYSAYSLFAYNYKGLDGNGNPVALKADGTTASLTNQLSNKDVLYQGTTQPPWYGGLTNTFVYRAFTLSGLIVYNLGDVMRDDVNQVYYGRLQANISNTFEDRWEKSGDENVTNVPKYIPNETTSTSERSTELYTKGNVNTVSASYIKLRDVTLTYAIPLSQSLKNFIRQIKIYGQINNVMIWTKNKDHIDPEYYNLSGGTRFSKMPPFYTIGVNVDF